MLSMVAQARVPWASRFAGRPTAEEWSAARRYRSALQSISVSLAEDQIRTRIAVNEGSIPLVSETMTMIEAPDAALAPRARSHRRRVGAERVHFVDPPKTIPESRRKLPINLPAFLEEPLSRLPERR